MTQAERFVRQRGEIKGSWVSERDEYGVARFRFGVDIEQAWVGEAPSAQDAYCNETVR
jgi:hypothetical protein